MGTMIIIQPLTISAIAVSRGSGGANLLSPDPKEAWVDNAVGSAVNIDIDLGASTSWDCLMLGFTNASAAATWTITGGTAGYTASTLKPSGALPAASRINAPRRHGLFVKAAPSAERYIRLACTQPAGAPLQAGIVLVGQAFRPTWNREWGSGRRPIDLGNKTALPSGGFAAVAGGRKAGYSWTFGDLDDVEVDALYAIALDRGESRPLLVVEDPDATPGLNERIHYGLFDRFESYDRQQADKTRWAMSIEQWI